MFTLIGLGKSGFLYRSHNTALQLSVVKKDSTMVQYVISEVRLLGISIINDINIWNK